MKKFLRFRKTVRAFPNPFREAATVQVNIRKYSTVEITLFDLLNERYAVLYCGTLKPGTHQFDVPDEPGRSNGMFLVKARINGREVEIRLIRSNQGLQPEQQAQNSEPKIGLNWLSGGLFYTPS